MTTPDDAREFLRSHTRGVLVTRRRDGGLQSSPVAATVDDDGRVIISTRDTAMKAKNLRRDPRATLAVVSDEWWGPHIQVEGTAEVIDRPEAIDLLVDYYRRVSGEHPDWDEYRQAMEDERRVLIRFEIERAGPTVSG